MSLAILFHLLCAQHVSDINISIFRSTSRCSQANHLFECQSHDLQVSITFLYATGCTSTVQPYVVDPPPGEGKLQNSHKRTAHVCAIYVSWAASKVIKCATYVGQIRTGRCFLGVQRCSAALIIELFSQTNISFVDE